MEQLINKTIEFVKQFFKNEYSGHDYFHTLRVYNTAIEIAKEEQANLKIVSLAALLHDVDDVKLSPHTSLNKDNARNFLKENNIDNNEINLICSIIDEVSYKGTDTIKPSSLEGCIVQDADRLDALGAIGIARAFAYGGHHNRIMYDPEILPKLNMTESEYRNHISTTVNHFYEKLFNLKKLMNTKKAIEIADEREKFMKDFISRFINEWAGNL